jgi:hypothetical protein
MEDKMLRPPTSSSPRTLVRQVDRCLNQVNGFLLALAIGLAILDATCFTALRVEDALMNAGVPIAPISQSTTASALMR